MKNINVLLLAGIAILLSSCLKNIKVTPIPVKQTMPKISVKGKYFADANGKLFIPWGFQFQTQYSATVGLIEDDWYSDTTWNKIKKDFKDMRDLKANIIRVALEYDKFMTSPTQPNQKNLNRLRQLVEYTEQLGVYLDITGLGEFRASDSPAWYNAMDEKDRWATQALFWQAIAKTIGGYNNVMCYNLMNEPVAPAVKTDTWLPGATFGGYNYVQNITRDPAKRSTDSIFRAWTKQLAAAIHQYDKKTMITVGYLPIGNIVALSPYLDYISTHVYPETGKIPQQVNFIKTNSSQTTKPLVIEEFYGLYATNAETLSFMSQTRNSVAGYLSYYDGNNPQAPKPCTTIACAIQKAWIPVFMGLKPQY